MDAAAWTGDRLAAVAASFDAAAARTETSAHRYRLAGRKLELRFASRLLSRMMTAAFAHLVCSDASDAPELSVRIWDSSSTGAPPPPCPDVPHDGPRGALYHFDEPPLRGAYLPGHHSLSILDLDARTAWYWIDDPDAQPTWEAGYPLRQILFWWLETHAFLQVHAAAIGTAAGGVLIVGKPGSGKSTAALSCLGTDLLYAGDDYVAVSVGSSPQVASLYCSGKLEASHVRERLPHLLPLLAEADHPENEKSVLYVGQHFPGQATEGFPLRAVLASTIRSERRMPRVLAISRAAALAAFAPTTMVQLHTAGAHELSLMSSLIKGIPCLALELGSDLRAVPATLRDLLMELSSA